MQAQTITLDIEDINSIATTITTIREKAGLEHSDSMFIAEEEVPHFAYPYNDGGEYQMVYLFPESLSIKKWDFGKDPAFRTTAESFAYSLGTLMGNIGFKIPEQSTLTIEQCSFEDLVDDSFYFDHDKLPGIELKKLRTVMNPISVNNASEFTVCYKGGIDIGDGGISIALLQPAGSGALFYFKHYSF